MTQSPPYTVDSVEFDRITGLLHANLSNGLKMPVYLYGPLNYDRKLHKVKWIDKWPDYASAYAVSYSPLRALADPPKGFSSRRRDSLIYPWVQATYQGFPLYIYGDGTYEDPANDTLPTDKKHMFQRVPEGVTPLEDDPEIGDPTVTRGP